MPAIIRVEAFAAGDLAQHFHRITDGCLKAEDVGLKLSFEELGYNVADIYLLSGLSNCGLNPDELSDVRSKFGSKINEFGLFSEGEDAAAFCFPLQ